MTLPRTENDAPQKKLRKKISLSYLENSGAYYLERFPASIAQFRKVMEQKIYKSCKDHPDQNKETCLSLLDQVVDKFVNLGYLNDQSYASALLYSLEQRGLSRMRIQLTMRNKGLPADLIESTIPERSDVLDKKAALRWAKKKRLGPFALKDRENNQQRALASLARAGFSYEIAQWVITLEQDVATEMLDNNDWPED